MTNAQRAGMYRHKALQHAKDVLSLAAGAGVPSSFWYTDARIQRAITTLELTTEEALIQHNGD